MCYRSPQDADRLEKVSLMAHGILRIAVIGSDDRDPSTGEMERVEQLLSKRQ